MPDLERLTTEYIPLEDRIRLTGQISRERVVTLWLTHKMLSLLLPNLFNWLEKSAEKTTKVNKARDKGYAPAIVVPEHNGAKAYQIQGSDTKFIPCPAQTKDNVDCIKCGLCFDADRLYNKNMGISFAVHGVKKNELKRRLTVLK